MTDYTPIPCEAYSRYELAILRARPLRLAWIDDQGGSHVSVAMPLDLETRAGRGEFLIARDGDGGRIEVRLDRIRSAAGIG